MCNGQNCNLPLCENVSTYCRTLRGGITAIRGTKKGGGRIKMVWLNCIYSTVMMQSDRTVFPVMSSWLAYPWHPGKKTAFKIEYMQRKYVQ